MDAPADLLTLQRLPEPLDKDVVPPFAYTPTPCRSCSPPQPLDELGSGELRALVAVEDLWSTMAAKRLLQRLDAEAGSVIGSFQAMTSRHRGPQVPRVRLRCRNVEPDTAAC